MSYLLNLEVYRELVNRCAEQRLNYDIANGSALHARILISKLFEVARTDVCIVTGKLTVRNPDGVDIYGYDDVLANARRFLSDPTSCLQIVVQGGAIDRGRDNDFLASIIEDENRNGAVEIFIPDSPLPPSVPHFMLSDGTAFRLETGADALNKKDISALTAVANFGDKKTSERLKSYFGLLAEYVSATRQTYNPGASYR